MRLWTIRPSKKDNPFLRGFRKRMRRSPTVGERLVVHLPPKLGVLVLTDIGELNAGPSVVDVSD